MINYKEKKELVNKIIKLLPIQQKEIFNIFNKNNINYTKNNNGVFINITNIDDVIVKEIENYMNYIKHNNVRLEKIETKCESIINSASTDINNIYKIVNFEEFKNLKDLSKLEKIKNDINTKKKKEYHLKFINTMKKYQRLLYVNNDFDLNVSELNKMEYLIK
jgi:hypothetical protein